MLLIAALPLFLEAEPRIGIPSPRLLTRQSLKAGSRLTFILS